MKYTKDDLRKAYEQGAKDYYISYRSLTEFLRYDAKEYIDIINLPPVEEDKISFTYSFLSRKLDWEKFCDLTGTNEWAKNEGAEFNDNDIYYVTESKAKQFNLI